MIYMGWMRERVKDNDGRAITRNQGHTHDCSKVKVDLCANFLWPRTRSQYQLNVNEFLFQKLELDKSIKQARTNQGQ